MKKQSTTLYSLLFLLGLVFQVRAQGNDEISFANGPMGGYRGSFHYGVTTALYNTWIKTDNEEQNNAHYRYQTTVKWAPVGLAVGYQFNDRHDLVAEAYVSRQGQHYDLVARGDGSGPVIGSKSIDLTYLQVPLLWKMSSGDATRFQVHFGAQVGFLLRGEEVNVITQAGGVHRNGSAIPTGTTTLAQRKDGKDVAYDGHGRFNKFDPNLVLGFGVEKDITDNLYLSGNLRFHYGFADIRAGETVIDGSTGDKYILRYNIYGGAQFGLHYRISKP